MTNTMKMRLIKGKHQAIDKDGNRYDMKVGQTADLTPDQAKAFKDKFEPAEVVEMRLKADAITAAEEKLTEANAELAAAKDDATKKAATDKVNAAKKALEDAKK